MGARLTWNDTPITSAFKETWFSCNLGKKLFVFGDEISFEIFALPGVGVLQVEKHFGETFHPLLGLYKFLPLIVVTASLPPETLTKPISRV